MYQKWGEGMSRVEPLLNWKVCSTTEQTWHAKNVWRQLLWSPNKAYRMP